MEWKEGSIALFDYGDLVFKVKIISYEGTDLVDIWKYRKKYRIKVLKVLKNDTQYETRTFMNNVFIICEDNLFEWHNNGYELE